MNIAFTINPLGLEGLGATLTSLVRNCSNTQELNLWFFCSGCTPAHKSSIDCLLQAELFKGSSNFIDFDAEKEFGHLRSLHGDWSSYGRLLIPDFIRGDTVLYLDADLIVLTDVLQLERFNFHGHFIAAAGGGKVKYALEREFLMNKLNITPEADYFNAGVLLMNLREWERQNVRTQWKEIANNYPDDLWAVDQTLLNAVCRGKFAQLPAIFNNAWCPGDKEPPDAASSIVHFVGSPKPWDMFGKTIHHGYSLWKTYSTAPWNAEFNRLTLSKMKRTWRIKNSILIKMKRKYLQKA